MQEYNLKNESKHLEWITIKPNIFGCIMQRILLTVLKKTVIYVIIML